MLHLSKNKILLTAFIFSMFVGSSSAVLAMNEDPNDDNHSGRESPTKKTSKKEDSWNPKQSMTPALKETINVSYVNVQEELVGKNGPSPSNQALVVMMTNKDDYVLMCKDYDLRLLGDGSYRPTHGALKASFGFGLPKGHNFKSSFEALVKGPANIALYNMFSEIQSISVTPANFAYSEGGEGWGPAVTIPVILKNSDSERLDSSVADSIVAQLNQKAEQSFRGKKADDISTGRFRDFTLVPLRALVRTGNDDPAVLDASKLEMIEIDGRPAKLWDESQMRKNLLPHVAEFISK